MHNYTELLQNLNIRAVKKKTVNKKAVLFVENY